MGEADLKRLCPFGGHRSAEAVIAHVDRGTREELKFTLRP